jgi:DNA-binding transcriptional LysR family regulator
MDVATKSLLGRSRADLDELCVIEPVNAAGSALQRDAGTSDVCTVTIGGRPTARVPLVAPRLAAKMMVAPRLQEFTRDYPDVVLDITTDDSPLDFVAGRFDAGIHLGKFIARDMIAVRVSRDQRAAIVAAFRYFESHSQARIGRAI